MQVRILRAAFKLIRSALASTLPDLVVAAFCGAHPGFAYKLNVLCAAAAAPWLIGLAGLLWRARPCALAFAIGLELIYIWTDFPINYVGFEVVPFFLAIQLGLVATGLFAQFLNGGGVFRWLVSAVFMSISFLVHLTTAMVIAPAALAAYVIAVMRGRTELVARPAAARAPAFGRLQRGPRRRLRALRHIGVWLVPVIVLLVNSFWWLPGLSLASSKGKSDFVM